MCNRFPTPVHTAIHTSSVLPATPTAVFRLLGIFEVGFVIVIKVAIAGSNPRIGLLIQQTFCFSSDLLARGIRQATDNDHFKSRDSMISVSVASHWAVCKLKETESRANKMTMSAASDRTMGS